MEVISRDQGSLGIGKLNQKRISRKSSSSIPSPTILLYQNALDSNMDFYLLFIYLMWTIFKVFIELVTILLLLMFWFFGFEACGFQGIQPAPGAWKAKS